MISCQCGASQTPKPLFPGLLVQNAILSGSRASLAHVTALFYSNLSQTVFFCESRGPSAGVFFMPCAQLFVPVATETTRSFTIISGCQSEQIQIRSTIQCNTLLNTRARVYTNKRAGPVPPPWRTGPFLSAYPPPDGRSSIAKKSS